MPLAKFTAQYLPKAISPTKPIRVGRDKSQARISIGEARELHAQLSAAIYQAEHNIIVTDKGTVLEPHEVNGFKYVTRPDS